MGTIMFLFDASPDPENADPWYVQLGTVLPGNISGGKLVSGLKDD